jgi:hypothetical protein
MERELNDVSDMIDPDDLAEMEERRIKSMNEAGIDEEVVLQDAHKNLETFTSYFNENIVRGKDDMNFTLRDQWTAVERSEFTRLFKPAMTFNKLYDPVKKIIGEQRKNKPDLIVRSLTGKASQEQIDLRADLVRTISYQSQNDLVYQTAFKSALLMGFGAFQVCIDYESPRSFNKIIRYEMITDPTRTSFDPKALKPHKGDGDWCSRQYIMGRDEFFATYPYVTNPVSYVDPYSLLDYQWQTRDTIVVADYFRKEWYPIKMLMLSTGDAVDEIQWEKMQKDIKTQLEITEGAEVGKIIKRMMPKIVAERQSQDYQIMHYRLTRNQIIDFSVWPSKQLPIVFVDGDSYYIEGRQYTRSFVHEARDAQKLLNYARSETAAELKNRRREQWIGTPDNIIGNEQMWRNPELQNGILMAKPDPKTGQMPQKMPAWEVSQGLFVTAQSATQDMKEILGFSETEQLQGRDISGKARRERKMEGSMSCYVYQDNLNQAVEQGGRIVNDLLPHIIGQNERTMPVKRKNGQSDMVTFNKRTKDDKLENVIEDGDYDVEINAGPSFAVQKEVSLEMFQQTIQAFPQAFPLIADLWAESLDLTNMPLIKERFKSMVPPEILAKEEGKDPPPPKPNPQQEMMKAELEFKKAEIQNKAQEIAVKQQKLELEKQEIILKAQETQSQTQVDLLKHRLDLRQAEVVHGHDKHKTELDFTHKIAKLLSEHHLSEGQMEHEKHLAKHKSATSSADKD